jgi:hypothetical protein
VRISTNTLVLLILLTIGCAQKQPFQKPMSWSDVQSFAEVTFQDAVWESNALRIPFTIRGKSGNSLHVLDFESMASGNIIEVTARLTLPDKDRPEPNVLVVDVDKPLEHYFIVYKNPDGSDTRIQQIAVRQF